MDWRWPSAVVKCMNSREWGHPLGVTLEEGIRFAECLNPVRIDVDGRGAANAITLARQLRGLLRPGAPTAVPVRAG